jgi:flagellar biosynthesis protein FlhF
LRSAVADLVSETRRSNAGNLPDGLYRTYQQLVSNAVVEELATKLVSDVRSRLNDPAGNEPEAVRAALAGVIEPMVPAAGPIAIPDGMRPYLVALIGPTGVGKTTTIAKLAANFSLRERKKVGLVTIDTYRIAAVEQLKTYAQIIDVPLEIAASIDQLKEAVGRLSDCDIILIDTAGRSQRDASRISQLKAFFLAVRPHELHLVLSSAANQKVLDQTIERFRDIGIDRLIFTKLDEALGFGVILNSLQKAQAKLSYVTMGQDVPSDIEVGEPTALTRLILANHCAA